MNKNFFELSEEKQNTILNAAMSVFAKNNYKRATTDEIIKKAGISKGLLFYYFENKKGLYLYLYDYASKLLIQEMSKSYNFKETDFFEILFSSQRCKMEVMKQHPYLFEFLTKAYLEKDSAVSSELNCEFNKIIEKNSAAVLQLVDKKKFKDEEAIPMLLKLVIWLSDGLFKNRPSDNIHEIEKLNDELFEYFNMLKKHFYKEEYL